MNNSFERLIDGMTEALRTAVIPHVDDEFARGQAFGVIFMLNSLKLRAGWTDAFLGEQLAALGELRQALDAVAAAPQAMPRIAPPDDAALSSEARRDAGDGQVAALIDWLSDHGGSMPADTRAAVEAAINAYLKRQIRNELTTSARPMFAEISLGREQDA